MGDGYAGYGSGFALIVVLVLFILLIIIGWLLLLLRRLELSEKSKKRGLLLYGTSLY
ncbi:YjcZ family sporulation protein [Peribacillus sp. B-H-3]|uniref:YjcZ family sporulation protein n=1 Tax=Peribacillus sp. B-H-3 TaxID=3400420 RepID=UPI003B01B10F